MIKISKTLENIGIVIAIIIALAVILGGILFFVALKNLDNPRHWIYCTAATKVPFENYSTVDLQLRFQQMYEMAYDNNGGRNFKLKQIIAPKNITFEEYYNDLNKPGSYHYEYFMTDKGGIVECGPYK